MSMLWAQHGTMLDGNLGARNTHSAVRRDHTPMRAWITLLLGAFTVKHRVNTV
jgi:hypothetical protein